MGKGDTKTRRGKLFGGSYGVRRPRKKSRGFSLVSSTQKPVKEVVDKAPPKPKAKAKTAPQKSSPKAKEAPADEVKTEEPKAEPAKPKAEAAKPKEETARPKEEEAKEDKATE